MAIAVAETITFERILLEAIKQAPNILGLLIGLYVLWRVLDKLFAMMTADKKAERDFRERTTVEQQKDAMTERAERRADRDADVLRADHSAALMIAERREEREARAVERRELLEAGTTDREADMGARHKLADAVMANAAVLSDLRLELRALRDDSNAGARRTAEEIHALRQDIAATREAFTGACPVDPSFTCPAKVEVQDRVRRSKRTETRGLAPTGVPDVG